MQIADDNANSSLLINGTELGDGVNEVEPVQYFLYKLGMKPHINSFFQFLILDKRTGKSYLVQGPRITDGRNSNEMFILLMGLL